MNKYITTQSFFVIVFLSIGLVLRLMWITIFPIQQFGDFAWFSFAGMNISDGLGYINYNKPTAAWPVGYPAYLGLIYYIFGKYESIAIVSQIILNLSAAYIFYLVIKKLFNSDLLALLCLGYLMIYMEHIASVNILGAENLFWLLLISGVYLLISAKGFKHIIGGSILFTLSVYVKPISIFIPFIVFLFYPLHNNYTFKNIFKCNIIIYSIIIIGISPWIIRNYNIFNKIGMSNNMGSNLFIGNNQYADGGYMFDEQLLFQEVGNWLDNEAEVDKVAKNKALTYIINNPDSIISLIPKKFKKLFIHDHFFVGWHTWRNFSEYKTETHDKTINYLIKKGEERFFVFQKLLPICLITSFLIVFIFKEYRKKYILPLVFFASLIAYLIIVHLVFFGAERFHYSMMPLLYLIIFFTLYLYIKVIKSVNSKLKSYYSN